MFEIPMNEFLANVFSTQWQVLLIVGGLLFGLAEVGYQFGHRLHRAKDEPRISQIGNIQGAVLGLLGLLLGFSFAMSVARYDARRDVVLTEANSIGTTYLRASLLPNPHREAIERLLRQYLDLRIEFYSVGTDRSKLAEVEKESAGVQRRLWEQTVAASNVNPSPIVATFIVAMNETIDLDAIRLHTLRSHVPAAVWLLLLAAAGVGSYSCGYSAGASGVRNAFNNFILPALIAVLITLIADLSRARHGLIGVDQRPLLELRESLQPAPTATSADSPS